MSAGPAVAPAPTASAASLTPAPCLLRVEHLSKSFGQVRALSDVSLDVPAGQVTALAGDNGAGKSVLIKCISGTYRPDAGTILWEGRPVELHRPRDASDFGIEAVYQDLALCDNLDIRENMFLGRERRRGIVLDQARMEQEAASVLAGLAVSTIDSVRHKVGSLSGGQRQSVAIARSALWRSKLVIMDEPTAALGITQTKVVLELVRRLAARGTAVILISHNMNDIFTVADRIAVLHLGRLVFTGAAADLDRTRLVDLMANGLRAT